jgi:hypothetical protein
MPIPERWRPTGGDVSSIDAEMLKQIEQTRFDATRCWCVQIFAPLFKKVDQFYEYVSAGDCKHILIDRHNLDRRTLEPDGAARSRARTDLRRKRPRGVGHNPSNSDRKRSHGIPGDQLCPEIRAFQRALAAEGNRRQTAIQRLVVYGLHLCGDGFAPGGRWPAPG